MTKPSYEDVYNKPFSEMSNAEFDVLMEEHNRIYHTEIKPVIIQKEWDRWWEENLRLVDQGV